MTKTQQIHSLSTLHRFSPADFGQTTARPTIDAFSNKILCGDAESTLRTLPEKSVQAIISSPPYYLQRDYSSPLQAGREATVEAYVDNLMKVFHECYRVLRDDGVFWLNLGDKYQDGEQHGVPWRVVFALKNAGWILRADIIWHKPNAMPHSGKTRPTVDHEYVFMLTKKGEYHYNADAIREPHVTFTEKSKMKGGRAHFGKRGSTPERGKNTGNGNLHDARWDQAFHPLGRNKRTVWSIPLSKFRGAHFAVFPETLVENCLKASTKAGDIVLDPFAGSGTVAVVATQTKRNFIMIDCNKAYCEMMAERLSLLTEQADLAL